jgi:hypothetical protein
MKKLCNKEIGIRTTLIYNKYVGIPGKNTFPQKKIISIEIITDIMLITNPKNKFVLTIVSVE